MLIDPIYPITWEETIIESEILRIAVQSKQAPEDLNEGNKDLEVLEHPDQISTEKGVSQFVKAAQETVFDGKFSPYFEMNNILTYELLVQNNVSLGDVPKILQRLIVGNSITIENIQEIFKTLCSQYREIKEEGYSFEEAAKLLFPDIFISTQDIYMTIFLKEMAKTNNKFRAFVGIHHVDPIVDLWNSDFIKGANFQQLVGIPDRLPVDTVDSLLEKHAILDVMLEENIWNLPYLSNLFPYLRKEEMNDEDMKNIKKKYYILHKRYSELKDNFAKK